MLMFDSVSAAQSLVEEINRARRIKLLEDEREDVKRIFGDKTPDYSELSNSRLINTDCDSLKFIYSKSRRFEEAYRSGETDSAH